MPVDSGMAFVVVMHLSPTHESTLAEMFQRSTAMPVVAATDGVTVEANSVYVIPPGKFLASANGHLRLTDAEAHRGKRVAVDYFFRTLAETHGAQSLAVVLYGSPRSVAADMTVTPALCPRAARNRPQTRVPSARHRARLRERWPRPV
jgi:two-component system, chemotaxis family, CheB/CheR fusion protein